MSAPDFDQAEFKKAYSAHCAKVRGATEEFLHQLEAIRKTENKDAEVIWNVAFHTNVVYHDLMVFMHYLTLTADGWERNTFARSVAVLLFEACTDIQQLQGGEFRAACKKFGFLSEVDSDSRAAGKYLSGFAGRNLATLKSIRNSVGAHREKDTFEMVRLISEIDLNKMFNLGIEFIEILKGYGAVNRKAMTALAPLLSAHKPA